EPEPGRASAYSQHREGERDRDQRIAECRAGPSEPEESEGPLAQRSESLSKHARRLRRASRGLAGATIAARNREFRLSSWTWQRPQGPCSPRSATVSSRPVPEPRT